MTSVGPGKSLGAQAAAGAVWHMAGFACLSLCGYIMAVLLARGFGPVAYGVYGVVYSVLLASEQILRLGIPQALSRLIGGGTAGDQSAIESAGVWIGTSVALAGFAILWAAAPVLAETLNIPNGELLFRIAILDIPFFSLYRILLHIMGGRRNFRAAGLVTCAYALTRAGGIALLYATDSLTIEGALIANVVASVFGAILLAFCAGMRVFRPTVRERRTLLATALPITVSDFGIQCLLGVDLWFLSVLGSSHDAEIRGNYVAAISLARGPNILAFVLISVLIPLIARARNTGEHAAAGEMVKGTMRFLLVVLVPACALIAANAAEVMVLFFGEQYRPGGEILAILIFAQGLGFTALSSLQAIVIGIGHTAVAWHRIYAGLVVAVVLNIVLVPLFGAIGAAVSALLAFTIANVLLGQFVRREMGVLVDWLQAVQAVAISLVLALAAWLIPTDATWVLLEIALLAVVGLGVMWAVGLIGRGDVAILLARKPKNVG